MRREDIFQQKERIGRALLERLKEFDVAAWTNKQSPITFAQEWGTLFIRVPVV